MEKNDLNQKLIFLLTFLGLILAIMFRLNGLLNQINIQIPFSVHGEIYISAFNFLIFFIVLLIMTIWIYAVDFTRYDFKFLIEIKFLKNLRYVGDLLFLFMFLFFPISIFILTLLSFIYVKSVYIFWIFVNIIMFMFLVYQIRKEIIKIKEEEKRDLSKLETEIQSIIQNKEYKNKNEVFLDLYREVENLLLSIISNTYGEGLNNKSLKSKLTLLNTSKFLNENEKNKFLKYYVIRNDLSHNAYKKISKEELDDFISFTKKLLKNRGISNK